VIFFGCSVKNNLSKEQAKEIVLKDLIEVSQDVRDYTKGVENSTLYDTQKKYENSYFGMWKIKKPKESLDDIKWAFRYFKNKQNYADNLTLIDDNYFKKMYEKSNFSQYQTINKKALSIKYANIRALPTSKPIFKNPKQAGEGFPFDYLQNSSINPNTPLFVSHYSKDKQWVFVFSSITFGWLKSDDIVFIDDGDAQKWMDAKEVFITKEGVTLFSENGEALFNTRVGMLFALIKVNKKTYTILTVSSYKNQLPYFHQTEISKDIATMKPLVFNQENLNKIIKEVSKTHYGWGGIYQQRDCSSTMLDLFTPFGIYLPRNSSKQSLVGEVINLDGYSDKEKLELIKQKGVAFETLLYKRGHIVLYVGTYNDKV
jgi:hypothetical protein